MNSSFYFCIFSVTICIPFIPYFFLGHGSVGTVRNALLERVYLPRLHCTAEVSIMYSMDSMILLIPWVLCCTREKPKFRNREQARAKFFSALCLLFGPCTTRAIQTPSMLLEIRLMCVCLQMKIFGSTQRLILIWNALVHFYFPFCFYCFHYFLRFYVWFGAAYCSIIITGSTRVVQTPEQMKNEFWRRRERTNPPRNVCELLFNYLIYSKANAKTVQWHNWHRRAFMCP